MTDLAAATRAPRPGGLRRLRHWDAGRGVLLLLGLLLVIAGYTLGARESSYDDLRGALVAGDVDDVTVHGESLGPESRGFTTLRVTWRDGLVPRYADVVETSRGAGPGSGIVRNRSGYDGDSVVVPESVIDDLLSFDPDLVVLEDADDLRDEATVLGWSVPGWMFWMPIALLLSALFLVGRRTEPWRATRWGWRWPILFLPVVGVVAYAAFSGPGLSPEPRDGSRRLTGGWSFILVTFVLVPLLT